MTGRASTLLGVMTVGMLLLAGASFIAADDRAIGSVLIAFGLLRAGLGARDYYRNRDEPDE